MARARFTLRIEIPEGIDPNTESEILDVMEEHNDTKNGALLRWLGDVLSDVEDELSSRLPEGWYAKIEEGKVLP